MVLLGWVIFIVALCASITAHEFGHFATAKKFGMKVTDFFVGIGPTLWSTRRGDTEYGVKALPVMGFVKIAGMTSLDEVDDADEPRSFRRHPGWQRIIVMVAGSVMHGILAFVILFIVVAGIGLANSNTTKLGEINSCVPANAQAFTRNQCTPSDATSPARRAGLRAGDTVVSFDGRKVTTWTQLGTAIRDAPTGRPVPVTVLRDGRRLTLPVTLATVHGRSGAYLGVTNADVFQQYSPGRAVTYAASTFGQVLAGSAKAFADLPAAVPHLFAKSRSHFAGGQVTSVVGVGEITGDVVSASVGWRLKADAVLVIVAELNIVVGAFNLLPLLPLDGGHVAIVLYERARAWLARLRGRADPGLVDMTKLVPVMVGVFAVLIAFGAMLMLADIVNPVGLS